MANIPFNAQRSGYVASTVAVGSRWTVTVNYDDGSFEIFSLLDEVKVMSCTRVSAGDLIGYQYPAAGCDLCSVGLLMPSQFNVGNSPLTENGNLEVGWNND